MDAAREARDVAHTTSSARHIPRHSLAGDGVNSFGGNNDSGGDGSPTSNGAGPGHGSHGHGGRRDNEARRPSFGSSDYGAGFGFGGDGSEV